MAVTVNGDRNRTMLNEFLFTKIEEEAISNIFDYNRMALSATQPKLPSMFYVLFLKIVLLFAELMSELSIICRMPSKISVTLTSQKQLTL